MEATGKGGHLGYSEGFNYNLYKSSYGTEETINSQGREQMHASLENLSKSMRLMQPPIFTTENINKKSIKSNKILVF